MRRVVIYLGGLAAVALALFVVAALILPRFVDTRLIRDKISSELAKQTGGSVTFGKIVFLWFPRPTVALENTEVLFDDGTRASVQTAKFYLSILSLLRGRFVVRRAWFQSPKVNIGFAERSEKALDVDGLETQIRSVLVGLATELQAPRIDLSDGSVSIAMGDKPPVIFENIAAQIVGSPAMLHFEIGARSNLCERFTLEGQISPKNLASQLKIEVERLKIKESLVLLPLKVSKYVQGGTASLDVKISSVGLRNIRASVAGSAGSLVVARGGRIARIEAKKLTSEFAYEDGALRIDLKQLDLGLPRLQASGELKINSSTLSAQATVRDLDIADMGDLARRIVYDNETVKKIFHHIPAGTIPEMSFQSRGRSFAEMVSSKNVVVSGLMRNGQIFIPGAELALKNVAGSVRISKGILEAGGVSVNLGTARGWNGNLRLGLEGPTRPFHLDILIQSAAPELQAILLKLVHDGPFRRELLKVRNVSGELSGRLILGERVNSLSPIVTVSKADIRAVYAPISFPIAIRAGRFHYDHRVMRVENAQGSLGHSTFGGLGATLHYDGSRRLKVDARRVSLDLQEAETLLRSFKNSRSYIEKLKSAAGRIELENLALAGAYDDPAGWTFASAGNFDQAQVAYVDLPDRITLSRGKFDANQKRTLFSDLAATMSDASFMGSGTIEYAKAALSGLETSGTGTLGAQMTQWLSRHAELPETLKIRSPVKITTGSLTWRAGGDVSFRGQATVAGGPLLSIDVVKHPQALTVRSLALDDGDRHAQLRIHLVKDKLDLSFKGELMRPTLDKVFASFPVKESSLSGDIQIHASVEKPFRFSALGRLEGSNLVVPLEQEQATVDKFRIDADGTTVLIRSADLHWKSSHIAISGKVTGGNKALRADLDVSADRIDWKELEGSFGRGNGERHDKSVLSNLSLEGTIRLKAGRLTYEHFNLSPLTVTTAISPSGIRANIDHGVACGITVTGRTEVVDKKIALNIQLAATDAQLEPTTLCLTDRQNDARGIYSLKAYVTGSGTPEHLLRSLKGDFEFTARDGEFVRVPAADATFDYLNGTGDFKFAFPDLDKETFPYRFVRVKGSIEGATLVGDEVNVESSLLNLSGQGHVDLEGKQIDGKGLIAVLKPAGDVISQVPVIGSIFGGSLIGIPIRITGSLERPDVTYLSPADVGRELLNIPLRILGIPLGAMRLFTPSESVRDKDIAQ